MIRRRLFLAVALLAWSGPVVRADDSSPIDMFVGGWIGQEVTSASVSLAPDRIELGIRADGDGFRMLWRGLGLSGDGEGEGDQLDAHFVPTHRPGVYEYEPEQGSMLARMLASPASGNPLEGETLLWARIEGSTLAVYSMSIDPNGAFDLGHYEWIRSEDGLQFTYSKRTEDIGAEFQIEAMLVSGGG